MIRRREFITFLGGAAARPLAAGAQQGDRVRRIGVLMGGDENEPEVKLRLSAFAQALADLGWTDGRNVRMYRRWVGGDISRIGALVQELVGLQPDITDLRCSHSGMASSTSFSRNTRAGSARLRLSSIHCAASLAAASTISTFADTQRRCVRSCR
jgi:hypothetical protein